MVSLVKVLCCLEKVYLECCLLFGNARYLE